MFSMSVETQSTPRRGKPGERLSNRTVDALGRWRFERMTLGVEHV